jgi:hypothetical protein
MNHLNICLIGTLLFPNLAWAGPPFTTDDPEPVEYHHWEVYLASQTAHSPDGIAGTLPQIEVNYGVMPNVQLHLITADTFDSVGGAPRRFGLGDTEVGVKYRFLGETDDRPQIGIFPLAELPTGNSVRGLGSGHTQCFLPVWAQKSFGPWTTYGGGGYWINPGPGNRNYWFAGWLLQRQLTKTFAVGAEIYRQTAQSQNGFARSQVNAGIIWDLNDNEHILASAGPSIQGPHGYQTYLAFQFTFGPPEKSAAP